LNVIALVLGGPATIFKFAMAERIVFQYFYVAMVTIIWIAQKRNLKNVLRHFRISFSFLIVICSAFLLILLL
jgi:hypothetical protein